MRDRPRPSLRSAYRALRPLRALGRVPVPAATVLVVAVMGTAYAAQLLALTRFYS
jgi:hypothetical protein